MAHHRGHSEYDSTPNDVKSHNNSKGDSVMTKRVVELLENGLNYLNRESVEEALKEFLVCEELYKKYHT